MANEKRLIEDRQLIDDLRTRAMAMEFTMRWLVLELAKRFERAIGRDSVEDGYHCSNCDIQAIYTGVKLNYCPNCGAKMDLKG